MPTVSCNQPCWQVFGDAEFIVGITRHPAIVKQKLASRDLQSAGTKPSPQQLSMAPMSVLGEPPPQSERQELAPCVRYVPVPTATRVQVQDRRVGRQAEETRCCNLRVGAVPNAAGSAYIEQGNTKIIASVYGPRQAERDRQQARAEGLLAVEVLFAPFCTKEFNREENEKREILYKSLLQGALESVILLERYAKTAFDITLLILEDDGAVLTSCLAAAAMALADARVEMRDLVAGATVHLLPDSGRVLLDCDREEERSLPEGSSVLHLGLCPRRGHLCLLHSVGPLPPGPFEQMAPLLS
eukprot:s989_g22.t3